jgi:hypothetical protein
MKKVVLNPKDTRRSSNPEPEYEYDYESEESVGEMLPVNMLDDVPVEGMPDPLPTVDLDSVGASYSYDSYSSSSSSSRS